MAHKTLIDGTAYAVKGGRDLIAGTSYAKKQGKTLIDGTEHAISFGIPLSTITPGAILYLNESGSPVPFYIAKHDYESGLNGAGRTLLVRKDCYNTLKFNLYALYANTYADGNLDSFLNKTYLKFLDSEIQTAISTTKFYYTPGRGDGSKTTLQRAIFQLSFYEFGGTSGNANKEGEPLPIRNTLKVAHYGGSAVGQWTRTPNIVSDYAEYVFLIGSSGQTTMSTYDNIFGSRPAFTLPGDLAVTANTDGTYTLAA